MGRRIVVSSNCQTGALHGALSAMLPDDAVTQIAWLGPETPGLATLLAEADVWVCSVPRDDALAVLAAAQSRADPILVPAIWFTAFHPDQTPILRRGGGELLGAVGPYHSKIVVWAWSHRLSTAHTIELFRPDVFADLGYLEAWGPAVDILRTIFATTDFGLEEWLLPLGRRGAFMLTNNHPRVDAIVQIARLVAARLGRSPAALRYEWELLVPDGLLATSVVWPVYPGIAEALDLAGVFLWRLGSGEFIGLEEFVTRSFASYASIDPGSIDTAHIDLDPRFASTLAPPAGPEGRGDPS